MNIILIILIILALCLGTLLGVYCVTKGIIIDMLRKEDFDRLYETIIKIKKQRDLK